MILVADILKEVISGLSINLNIYYVQDLGTTYECRTINTLWFKPKNKIVLGGITYTVVSFVLNEKLILSGSVIPTKGGHSVTNPTFKHGKLKQTIAEIQKDKTLTYPLIWMFELSPRTTPQEVNTVLESTGSVRLFFMNTSNYKDFTTEDHYEQVINPVGNLIDLFIPALKKHKRTGKVFISSKLIHAKFTNDNGITAGDGNNILPSNLSGIEMEIIIPLKNQMICPTKNLVAT